MLWSRIRRENKIFSHTKKALAFGALQADMRFLAAAATLYDYVSVRANTAFDHSSSGRKIGSDYLIDSNQRPK